MDPYNPQIRQDYAYRDDRRVNGKIWPVQTIKRMVTIAAATLTVLVLLSMVFWPANAQTPQDGYWNYQMTPDGMTLQNPAQGYGFPSGRPRAPSMRSYGRSYDQPPTYYNEYGQPSTTPDPRQYRGIEGTQM